MRRFLLGMVTVVLVASASGCGGPTTPPVTSTPLSSRYTDATGTLSFVAPPGWEIFDLGEGERALLLLTPREVATDMPEPGALDVPAFAMTLIAAAEPSAAEALRSDLPEDRDVEVSEITEGTMKGYPLALATLHFLTTGGTEMQETRAAVLLDSKVLRIRQIAPLANWEQYAPVFQKVWDSIEIHL